MKNRENLLFIATSTNAGCNAESILDHLGHQKLGQFGNSSNSENFTLKSEGGSYAQAQLLKCLCARPATKSRDIPLRSAEIGAGFIWCPQDT